MVRDRESLKAAQLILCNNAMNLLTSSYHMFQFTQHIDGRDPKGRQILTEQLIEIEDRLAVVKSQIQAIRNLYMEG